MPAIMFPTQHATWTEGPSLPTERPDAITRGYKEHLINPSPHPLRSKEEEMRTSVILLTRNVQNPKKPFMMNPPIMHLISEIPEPAAYLANDRTRCAAMKENAAYRVFKHKKADLHVTSYAMSGTHRKQDVYCPPCRHSGAPLVPCLARVPFVVDLPTAELLVQPPSVRAIPHLDVREPFSHY